MRSEKEVYDIVLNFAKTDKRIRMVTLEGSRTNTNIPPDDFQDFDITFFVTDMDSFTSDDKWLDIFGERLILQTTTCRSLLKECLTIAVMNFGILQHM